MTSPQNPKYRPTPSVNPAPKLPAIVKLWLLRMLVLLNGSTGLSTSYMYESEKLGAELGLPEALEGDKLTRISKTREILQNQLALAEKEARTAHTPEVLARNVKRVAELINLNHTEILLFEFSILMKESSSLKLGAQCVGDLEKGQVPQALATILDVPLNDIRHALRPDGTLARSGLLHVYRGRPDTLDDKLKILSDSLHPHLVEYDVEPETWLKHMISKPAPSHLSLDDYAHVNKVLVVLRPYLRQSMHDGRKGVNVFIYGPPGTGKSQLAKLLAQDCGCELFEVTTEDEDGDAIDGDHRVKALCAANSFFAQRKAMILFDEVEDVFSEGGISALFSQDKKTVHKGRINRILESNPLPTVWVSNSSRLDPAFVRRFDVVMELPVPPKAQRERIIDAACKGLLPTPSLARMAESEKLAPAVVTRASKVVLSIHDHLDATVTASSLELLVNQTLQAQGHKHIATTNGNRLPDVYDPAFINTTENLSAIAAQIAEHKTGRLCLYGPPGTGKTAFGRWLAEQMDVPLHVKRASDLFDMYVGGSEKNIAAAFAQAQEDGAVLLIDEVDSFLQDRQGAQRSWEVTQVNEMLTQIESFNGVLIASTNLMGQLDAAALRRFDLKLNFDYLRPEQAEQLLQRYCQQLELEAPTASDNATLRHLGQLTPGDFAAVLRQNRLRPFQAASQLVQALSAECDVKPNVKRAIGFIH